MLMGKNERSIRDILLETDNIDNVRSLLIKKAVEIGKGNVQWDPDLDGLRDYRNEIGDQIIWQDGDNICRVGNTFLRIGGMMMNSANKVVSGTARAMLRRGKSMSDAIDFLEMEGWTDFIAACEKNEDHHGCPVSTIDTGKRVTTKCIICNKKITTL